MENIRIIIEKWDTEYNKRLDTLNSMRDHVSNGYLKEEECILDKMRSMINDVKGEIHEASSN